MSGRVFHTFGTMQSQNDADERVESVPWEHIGKPDDANRRRLVVVALAVFVAAVTASATRTLWPAPPLSVQPVTSPTVAETTAPPSPAPIVPSSVPARPVTEADLRALLPEDAERAVSAHAQWFVTEWLTVDGSASPVAASMTPEGTSLAPVDASVRSFVESAIVLSVTEAAEAVWDVAVLVRTLSSTGDGDYLRIPPRVFLVTVGIGDEGPFVLDLPTPGPLPVARSAELELVTAEAPGAVVGAAIAVMSEAGLVDESSVTSSTAGGLWRLDGVVRDPAGVPLEVVVWLDDSGSRVPAPTGSGQAGE